MYTRQDIEAFIAKERWHFHLFDDDETTEHIHYLTGALVVLEHLEDYLNEKATQDNPEPVRQEA